MLTNEDTQHPAVCHGQSSIDHGKGVSCACPVIMLKEEILQSVHAHYPTEGINEQGLTSETTLHAFIPAKVDIWEI